MARISAVRKQTVKRTTTRSTQAPKRAKKQVFGDGFERRASRATGVLATPRALPAMAANSARTAMASRLKLARGIAKDRDAGEKSQVATYNLGGGNDKARERFDQTARHLAGQVTGGAKAVDVTMLQEVSKRGRDYNEDVLKEVFRAQLGEGFDGSEIKAQELDAQGKATRYTVTNDQGETRYMTLERERLDQQGKPFSGEGEPPVEVYSARMDNGRTHTMVFGASDTDKDSDYGNAVLLGPGYQLPRGADGKIDPKAINVVHLGDDPTDAERRTALSVRFKTPDGDTSTAISAHLSNGGDAAEKAARSEQYEKLYAHAEQAGEGALVGGDFNSKPGERHSGWWLWSKNYPKPESGGLENANQRRGGIDHVLVGKGLDVTGAPDRIKGGGSDHDMVAGEVDIKGAPAGAPGAGGDAPAPGSSELAPWIREEYQATLFRPPTSDELRQAEARMGGMLDQGKHIYQVGAAEDARIKQSEEFRIKHPHAADIARVYDVALGRAPNNDELKQAESLYRGTLAEGRSAADASAALDATLAATPEGLAHRPPGPAYPLGVHGMLNGRPRQGTHNLGNWQSDNAIDINIPVGTPVYAIEDGVIGPRVGPLANTASRFAGNRLTLESSGNAFYYAHLDSLTVQAGQQVKKGELIGYSGSANGCPHLHLGVREGDPVSMFGY